MWTNISEVQWRKLHWFTYLIRTIYININRLMVLLPDPLEPVLNFIWIECCRIFTVRYIEEWIADFSRSKKFEA